MKQPKARTLGSGLLDVFVPAGKAPKARKKAFTHLQLDGWYSY